MKLKVTEEGIIIPKALLEEIEEVEIHKENETLVITSTPPKQSIWGLGTNPVESDVTDASLSHDNYIYDLENYEATVKYGK